MTFPGKQNQSVGEMSWGGLFWHWVRNPPHRLGEICFVVFDSFFLHVSHLALITKSDSLRSDFSFMLAFFRVPSGMSGVSSVRLRWPEAHSDIEAVTHEWLWLGQKCWIQAQQVVKVSGGDPVAWTPCCPQRSDWWKRFLDLFWAVEAGSRWKFVAEWPVEVGFLHELYSETKTLTRR